MVNTNINFYILVHAVVVENVLSQYVVSIQAELLLLDAELFLLDGQ
jgi:hypothetical protein